MIERIRNVIKTDRKRGVDLSGSEHMAVPKRSKKQAALLERYPMSCQETTENAETLQQHMKNLGIELSKAKPRDSIILPLMKSTYADRRAFVLNDSQTSVNEIISKYPAMRHLAIVSILIHNIYRRAIYFRG